MCVSNNEEKQFYFNSTDAVVAIAVATIGVGLNQSLILCYLFLNVQAIILTRTDLLAQ